MKIFINILIVTISTVIQLKETIVSAKTYEFKSEKQKPDQLVLSLKADTSHRIVVDSNPLPCEDGSPIHIGSELQACSYVKEDMNKCKWLNIKLNCAKSCGECGDPSLCSDSTETFRLIEEGIITSCEKIKDDTGNLCNNVIVKHKCPVSCNKCPCVDTTKPVWINKSLRYQSCEFVADNLSHCKGKIVPTRCPKTCNKCEQPKLSLHPTEEPPSQLSYLPTSSKISFPPISLNTSHPSFKPSQPYIKFSFTPSSAPSSTPLSTHSLTPSLPPSFTHSSRPSPTPSFKTTSSSFFPTRTKTCKDGSPIRLGSKIRPCSYVKEDMNKCKWLNVKSHCAKSCGECGDPSLCSDSTETVALANTGLNNCKKIKDFAGDKLCSNATVKDKCRLTCNNCPCVDTTQPVWINKILKFQSCEFVADNLSYCEIKNVRTRCPKTCNKCEQPKLSLHPTFKPSSPPPTSSKLSFPPADHHLSLHTSHPSFGSTRDCKDKIGPSWGGLTCIKVRKRADKVSICRVRKIQNHCKETCNMCSNAPSLQPEKQLTYSPSNHPTDHPTDQPTDQPTYQPTNQPTDQPTNQPTISQHLSSFTSHPSFSQTYLPSSQPTNDHLSLPTSHPTITPTQKPSDQPTLTSQVPTSQYSSSPTLSRTVGLSYTLTSLPSVQPSSTVLTNVPSLRASLTLQPSSVSQSMMLSTQLPTSLCKDKKGIIPNYYYKGFTNFTCKWVIMKKSERKEICKKNDVMNHCKKTCNNCPSHSSYFSSF